MTISFLEISIALIIGICTGFVLQRGRVCTNTAFRNLLIARNSELALVIVITVAIELVGYQILAVIPGFTFNANPISFSFIFLPVGAFLFGFGTVIAGGCAGGVCYRIGEGSINSVLAFLGFASGIGLIVIGPLSSIVDDIRNETAWVIKGSPPSLEAILPRWTWTLIAVGLAILAIYRYRAQASRLTHLLPQWTPIVSGALLGSLGILVRYFSTRAGRPFGFSTVDGISDIFTGLANVIGLSDTSLVGWAGIFIIGLILGSFISSIQIGEFKIRYPSQNGIIRFYGGGLILGVGAMLALGCNFGHIFGGIPELGISSLVAIVFMIVGNWVGSYLYYNVKNQELPKSTPKI